MTCWPNRKPDLNELIRRSFATIDEKIEALCDECEAPQIEIKVDNEELLIKEKRFIKEEILRGLRNHGSWCANNALEELNKLKSELKNEVKCLCNIAKFEYLGDASGPFLDED